MTTNADQDDAYIPVAVATLVPATVTPFSLFKHDGGQYRLYRDANFPFELEDRERLVQQGLTRLYVAGSDMQQYRTYLRTQLDSVLADESLPIRERMGGLNEVVRNVLQEDFARGDAGQIVNSAQALASQTVQMICRTDAAAGDLLSVMYHDYHTFTHSANVTYFSVLLAWELKLPLDDLRLIAAGGLLHDLGKLQVPEKILNKNGRLDDDEFAIVKRHPGAGFQQLCHREDLTWGQLMMVYQHHEDFRGGGYPVGSVGDEIHPWARICAVADVFEALTANRPYRVAMSRATAFDLMHNRMADKFEPELFRCFQAAICRN
ncbi:MAG: HD domain-containing protein [Planctomycetaceae bacterium]|nr:HD domain-containing protein [Planctomycetaceae bacterium]